MSAPPRCGESFQSLSGGSLAVACAGDAEFSLTKPASASTVSKVCASASCVELIAHAKCVAASECVLSVKDGILLYRDILDPVASACSNATVTRPEATQQKTTEAPASTTTPVPPHALVANTTTQPHNETAMSVDDVGFSARSGSGQASSSIPSPSTAQAPTQAPLNTTQSIPATSSPLANASSESSSSSANATLIKTASAQPEHLDMNMLLAAIACGVAVIAIVGFVAFYFDHKRGRKAMAVTPPVARRGSQENDESGCHTGDSYDHFSPVPVWHRQQSVVPL